MTGMKYVVNNMEHRKEFITGNLTEFMTKGTIFLSALCAMLTPGQNSSRCPNASVQTMPWISTNFDARPGIASG